MFLKLANFDMENGFFLNQMSPEIIYMQRKLETGKDTFWKAPELHGQGGGLPHFKINVPLLKKNI